MTTAYAPWREIDAGVAVLELAGATETNELDEALARAITASLMEIAASDHVRVVLLRGKRRYFSSGASLELLGELTAGARAPSELSLPRDLLACPVPIVACLEGAALGGGLALALACDFTLLSHAARYGFTFMNFGITPGMGTTGLSEAFFGRALAHELLFTGRTVRGHELAGCPGVSRVLPSEALFDEALDLARQVAGKTARSVRLLKEALAAPRRALYERAFIEEQRMHEVTFRDPETRARLSEWATPGDKRHG